MGCCCGVLNKDKIASFELVAGAGAAGAGAETDIWANISSVSFVLGAAGAGAAGIGATGAGAGAASKFPKSSKSAGGAAGAGAGFAGAATGAGPLRLAALLWAAAEEEPLTVADEFFPLLFEVLTTGCSSSESESKFSYAAGS